MSVIALTEHHCARLSQSCAPDEANTLGVFDRQKSADSVENSRVSPIARNLTGEEAFFARCYVKSVYGCLAALQDFNLMRSLFCRENHLRLFQQNRPEAAGRPIRLVRLVVRRRAPIASFFKKLQLLQFWYACE